MKKLIQRHKGLAIVGGLTLILLIIIFAIFARMFLSNGDEYGDRLKNLVKIDNSTINEVKDAISEYEEVEEISIRTQGKIIYTTITYTETTKKDKAKEIASKTLEYYDEEVIKYYDFEYLLNQKIEPTEEDDDSEEEPEDKSFYIAGTKHPDLEKISWTKN